MSIDSNPVIGIIGGGQLGKMLALEAKRMSFGVIVLDPTPDCPAASVSDEQIVADFKNLEAIENLAKKCSVLTYEIELGNVEALKKLQKNGCNINPSPETLEIIQDKFLQKTFLKKNGIPVPDFARVNNLNELKAGLAKFGCPAMLKACKDSYDGRGNILIEKPEDAEGAFLQFRGKDMMLEKFVPFTKEVSVMVARSAKGEIACYPLVENIHKDSILNMTIAPARVDSSVMKKAEEIATKTMEILKGAGIFGIEMFVTAEGEILINEIAPRPHNSGHYTIEACHTSQFEQHIRAILGLPLGDTTLLSPAVMINILGDDNREGNYKLLGMPDALFVRGANLHIYGKHVVKKKRKMGHITVLDQNIENAIRKAEAARAAIKFEVL
ncbi:MAG: 5-(carboxyamino)imidazole ribonucleotide synthase [Candidatus Aenigmatarchaeota archaeon]